MGNEDEKMIELFLRVSEIDWDFTDEDLDEDLEYPEFPTSCVLTIEVKNTDPDFIIDETIANALSDEYGYCVNGFVWEVIEEKDLED